MQDDGSTTRQHLESIERQTGVTPAQLLVGTCPLEVEYIWGWFLELSRKRRTGGMDICSLVWADVEAWARLMRRSIEPWEVEALMTLDIIWLNAARKQ